LVFYCKTSVHDDSDACRLELTGYLRMTNTLLHPHQLWPDFQQLVQQGGNVLRAPENVYNVDRTSRGGGGAKIVIHLLTQGHAARRMHRNDGVTSALEIGRHAVARPFRFAAQAYDSDATRISDELRHLTSIQWHP
jgi:hypothetical protein